MTQKHNIGAKNHKHKRHIKLTGKVLRRAELLIEASGIADVKDLVDLLINWHFHNVYMEGKVMKDEAELAAVKLQREARESNHEGY